MIHIMLHLKYIQPLRVGITKTLFANFSVSDISVYAKLIVRSI